MGEFVVKLPDAGEGVAEAEVVEWHVEVGKMIKEDDILAVVMTDKAAVEIRSPVEGSILWLGAEIGDTVAVGSPIMRIEVDGEGNVTAEARLPELADKADLPEAAPAVDAPAPPEPAPKPAPAKPPFPPGAMVGGPARREGEKPIAAPSVRRRAKMGGVDLRQARGTGPAGRITHEDLDAWFSGAPSPATATGRVADTSIQEIKVVGLRRKIAERMTLSTSRIAHITYVEEVDMTELEKLRETLNAERGGDRARLTILPFLMQAMVKAIRRQPIMNAHFDDEAGVIRQFGGVHIGVATQTPNGLVVPVARHVEARGLWDSAAEVGRLSELARTGMASREELSGSTITITSLGALGGLVTTPVINHPEVAIVGVNKLQVRPVWDGRDFVPRKMMNMSSSFDHRIIDGMDAAVFVQAIKRQLETPATIFMED
ncbi:MAG: 2-oxo acid dehydrogenase subunit E2 [Alphaproteobacteria bacterium]|nr:2-oxo acid dehydrogenase subunit E2 [Alphaproteobacteria bacterium]